MSKDIKDIYEALRAPFNPTKHLSWRPGPTNRDKTKAMALAYVDARTVMQRLDDAVGFENWQDEVVWQGDIPTCHLSLRIGGEWIKRSCSAGKTDVEGEKGGASDAFKRAAVKFGVARYLYHLPAEWVEVENGRIKSPPKLPEWATPEGWDRLVVKRDADAGRTLTESEMDDAQVVLQDLRREKGEQAVRLALKRLNLTEEGPWTDKQLRQFCDLANEFAAAA